MPKDLESLYERAQSDDARLDREHAASMSRLARRRRERRRRWPPRLRFQPYAEGGELIVRPAHQMRVLMYFLLGTTVFITAWQCMPGRDPLSAKLPYIAVEFVAMLYFVWAMRRVFLSTRILLLPGGKYIRQDRDWLGRFVTSPFGTAFGQISRVEFDYEDALWKLKWDGCNYFSMSDPDIATAQQACASVGIEVILPSNERRNKLDHTPPDRRGEWIWKLTLAIIGSSLVYLWFGSSLFDSSTAEPEVSTSPASEATAHGAPTTPPALPPQHLEGTFRSENRTLGTWTLTPERCVSGRELGFEGLAFFFPEGSPVTELRLEAGASSENYAEWRFADTSRKPYRLLRRDCDMLGGKISAREIPMPGPSGRSLQQLTGNLELDCPKKRIYATAAFDGCLPPLE